MTVNDLGKNSRAVVIAAITVVTVFITAVLVPMVKRDASNAEILQRLKGVEVNTQRLESIPEKVAALTEATSGLKVSVDRLEKKLDGHVDRDK